MQQAVIDTIRELAKQGHTISTIAKRLKMGFATVRRYYPHRMKKPHRPGCRITQAEHRHMRGLYRRGLSVEAIAHEMGCAETTVERHLPRSNNRPDRRRCFTPEQIQRMKEIKRECGNVKRAVIECELEGINVTARQLAYYTHDVHLRPPLTAAEIQQMQELAASGMKARDIATTLKRSYWAVVRYCPTAQRERTPHHCRTYPPDLKDKVIGRYLAGERVCDLARDTGVHKGTVETWCYPYRHARSMPRPTLTGAEQEMSARVLAARYRAQKEAAARVITELRKSALVATIAAV
jgi:transposase-like protein